MDMTDLQWQQGEMVEVTITDLDDQGNGVGRVAERVVFVPDTVPGDRVRARLTHVKPQYGHALSQRLLTPSADRIQPACIVADKCGGCQWQHVAYDRQLLAKHNQIVQALQRIGGISNLSVDPIIGSSSPLGYRNKATYPLGERTTSSSPLNAPSQPQDYQPQDYLSTIQESPKLRTPHRSLRTPRPLPRPVPRPLLRTPHSSTLYYLSCLVH